MKSQEEASDTDGSHGRPRSQPSYEPGASRARSSIVVTMKRMAVSAASAARRACRGP
jgi:hypothetical protein